MEKNTLISIIIPTFNEEENIGKCLLSLLDSDLPKDRYEIIIVDNGSIDHTLLILEKFNCKVFVLPKLNISSLRNYGAKSASGKYFAFLDADCLVEKGWFAAGVCHFNNTQIAAVGAPYKIPQDSTWVAKAWSIQTVGTKREYFTNYIPAGNLFIRRDCFFEVEGFNERLTTSEDTDLCYRLRQKGYKILVDQDISVIHLGAIQNLKKFFTKELWYGKDIFKIFLFFLPQLRNLSVVCYAVYYVLILLSLGLGIILFNKNIFLFSVIASILPSLILSVIYSFKRGKTKYLLGLWVLYTLYGIARSFCILDIRNWAFKKNVKK